MGKHQTIGFATMPLEWRIKMQRVYEGVVGAKQAVEGPLTEYLPALMHHIDNIERPPLACKSRCHYCCHQQVTISMTEAKLLLNDFSRWIRIKFKKNHLLRQARYDVNDYHYDDPDSRCIFLSGNGECAVYNCRPLVCRSTAIPAGGNPELCKVAGQPQMYQINYDIETIISAFWHGEEVKPLPHMMLKLLKEKDRYD